MVTVWAAQAVAALADRAAVTLADVASVAELSLTHRRSKAAQQAEAPWTEADAEVVRTVTGVARS